MPCNRNILFIMCDQLRQDYLSCYGHQTLATPNIDSLTRRGVKFTQAYCQAPLCGPSRASFYSGRYQSSHGVMGNNDATQLGEKLMADYLKPLGYRSAVVGKTHNRKSLDDLKFAQVDLNSDYALAASSGGFEPYEWHEGLFPDPILPEQQGYTDYLTSLGYSEPNPLNQRANSSIDRDGRLHSGWSLQSAKYPAAIPEEHSETAFITRRAMDFMMESEHQPWCLHLSYIKPHWPLIAPAPYHNMYNAADIQTLVCSESEIQVKHPVVRAFMQQEYSQSYQEKEIRDLVIPVYMGLIKQIDDQLGELFRFMESVGIMDNTMIVFTSDHGDCLGDHFLVEKDLFHTPSVKIPFIVVNPDAAADVTRGHERNELVEAIDILPTFVEFAGGEVCQERMEGLSLIPMLITTISPKSWRSFSVSEIDYSERGVREILEIEPYECRATMIATRKWKYIYYTGFPDQLFDLQNDPNELIDLGGSLETQTARQEFFALLFEWKFSLKSRVGINFDHLQGQSPRRDEQYGIIIGRR